MDIEREIVATLTDAGACTVYQSKSIAEMHFCDKRYAEAYGKAMGYYRTHGRMVDAPPREVVEEMVPGFGDICAGVTGAAPSYLADELLKLYTKRQVEQILSTTLPAIRTNPIEAAALIRDSLGVVSGNVSGEEQCIEYGKDMDAYRRMAEARDSRQGAPYPFPEMQSHTGGIKPGEMAVLVGPSGRGKSQLAVKTALEAVRQGWNVYFATLELEPLAIAQRMEFMEVNNGKQRVSIRDWTSGVRIPQYMSDMKNAQERIAAMDGRLVIDQPRVQDRTPASIVQACKSHRCNFLIVDQLQFVTKPQRDNMAESVGLVMQEFKQQLMSPADNVRVPMLLLHQMNRTGVKAQEGTGKIGSMSDIAHSSWVEQLADVVWGIGNNREEAASGVMNIATLKSRSFSAVGWRLDWDMDVSFQMDIMHDEAGRPVTLEDW